MATVPCIKCTAERRGFRRELDSWRHKLIHCIGFESILEGIYGPMLMTDLNLFADCEPEDVDDWSLEGSCSKCSFCNLPLDKLSDQAPVATSPLSSPSDYSPCQAPTPSESQSAHQFLHAVFHKKDVPPSCNSNIPLIAQELMKKMIHQFALEYASECLLHTETNGVVCMPSPLSEASDVPLDLTVTRTQDEKEIQPVPDGVLDLSSRNSTCSAPSQKFSGSTQSSFKEELRCLGQQGKSRCVLDSVLTTLCQPHRSLLYQILKLAHQEKLLAFINHRHVGPTNSHCGHCGMNPQSTVTPHSVAVDNFSLCHSVVDGDHYRRCNTKRSPEDSKSYPSVHHYPFKDCKLEEEPSPRDTCVQNYRVETYSVLCSESVHCHSCQNPVNGRTANPLCPCEPLPPHSQAGHCVFSTDLSLSPQTCNCQQSHSCPCDSIQSLSEQDVGEQDPSRLVLKREQSPSPPPLSPIYSETLKKTDDKPPSLLSHEQKEHAATLIEDNILNACQEMQNNAKEQSQNGPNQSGTSLQDLMKRFSEKLETIKPSEKDPNLFTTAIYVSEEQRAAPSTSQKRHFHADAHLTEIITTVLHTGCASDYSLSELFNHHQNREPKSPNTRARRRQEVLAAIAKPTDDPSTRRQSLQIKRELAMLDQSCNKRKKKRGHLKDRSVTEMVACPLLEPLPFTRVSEREYNGVVFSDKPEVSVDSSNNPFIAQIATEDLKTERQMVDVAHVRHIKAEEDKSEISVEESEPTVSNIHKDANGLQRNCGKCDNDHLEAAVITKTARNSSLGSAMKLEDATLVFTSDTKNRTAKNNDHSPVSKRQKCQSNFAKGERRSRRNIVPPQRFSSYVTEPRNTFFVACFSEGVFNRCGQKEKNLMSSSMYSESEVNSNELESDNKVCSSSPVWTKMITNEKGDKIQLEPFNQSLQQQCQSLSESVAADKLSSEHPSPHKREKVDVDCCVTTVGRLRSATRKLQLIKAEEASSDLSVSNASTTSVETSLPDAAVHYSSPIKLMFVSPLNDNHGLRYSLKSGSQAEHFDPCEESSWSGTPQRHRGPNKRSASSPVKSPHLRTRSASSSPTSHFTSSPSKSPCRLRSASSSPRNNSKRSTDESPSFQYRKAERGRSPGGIPSLHVTTPPKRRPGRPKKLGPPSEPKVKKPIGRPRKEKTVTPDPQASGVNGKSVSPPGVEECETKNLKITLICGRSRRNKRTVSESVGQLEIKFNRVKQPVDDQLDFGNLLHCSKTRWGIITKNSEELNILASEKEQRPQVTCNVKCQDSSIPPRKPGRPPKVKISGISVTITTSPWQRKIQLNKDHSPEATVQKKNLSDVKLARKTQTSHHQSPCDQNESAEMTDVKAKIKEERSSHPVPLRHSLRVRKPSIHFLRAVATSTFRSYSRSSALLRRSKQLLLNKANNERRLGEQQSCADVTEVEEQLCGAERRSLPDLSGVAEVTVDSIFAPEERLKWWAASAEDKKMNRELARRIHIFSDNWILDTEQNQHKETTMNPSFSSKAVKHFTRTTKHASVVRALFDCPPDKPSSCSIQQIGSWFMETTETKSLAIVKKATSRNHYDPAQFSRSTNKTIVCPNPQAERLRKHVKKFAKVVPKTPLEHQAAVRRFQVDKSGLVPGKVRRQLFTHSVPMAPYSGATGRTSSTASKLQAVLFRARNRFLTLRFRGDKKTRDERKVKPDLSHRNINNLQTKPRASRKATKRRASKGKKSRSSRSTNGPPGPVKEQQVSRTVWSPETLKECRVFLKKINSPHRTSTEKDSSSCALSDGSPSPHRVESEGAVDSDRKLRLKTASSSSSSSSQEEGSSSQTAQEWNKRQRGKAKSPVVLSDEPLQPPAAKQLRQSRTRRLTGPKWSDFVFGNYLALFD